MIATTKQNFDAKAADVRTFVVNITLMERSMRHYVPSLLPERQILANFAQTMLDRLWAVDPSRFTGFDAMAAGAAGVSMSMFLIVEVSTPFNGSITIPRQQMERALAETNHSLRTPP